jgi:hypothetical protein
VISRLFSPGQDISVTSIVSLYTRLFRKGVTLTPHTDLVAVEGSTVVVTNAVHGCPAPHRRRGHRVLSMGSCSTDTISRALRNRGAALHAIGDGVAPRGSHQTILEGTRVARAI